MRRVLRRLKRVLLAFVFDDALTMAAAISFYAVTALSPLLVVLVGVAAVVLPQEDFKSHLLRQTDFAFGHPVSSFVGSVLQQTKVANGWTALVGLGFIMVSSAALFSQLHVALNRVWNIKPSGGSAWKLLIKDRLVAMVVVLLTGALLISSLFLSTWLGRADQWAVRHLGLSPSAFTFSQNGLSFLLLTAMCALLFRTLPDTNIAWKDVAAGATLTAGLFLLAKSLFAHWLSGFDVTARYGQVGAVVLLLLWLYFTSVIFLLGAEWTKVQADARGRTIRSSRGSSRARLLSECRIYPRLEAVVSYEQS